MNVSKLAALVLVALLVTAGAAAAVPATATDHSGAADHEQASDHRSDEAADGAAVAAEGGAEAVGLAHPRSDDTRGPPTDLPEQVPDHVTRIHQLILDFLSGDLDGNLGPSVSDAT